MILDVVLKCFEDSVGSPNRDQDRAINTISTEFSNNPEALKDFPILILQSTFQRAKIYQFSKHYDLLSKILMEILRTSIKTLEKHKKNLIKELFDYSEKCSKCVQKSHREGIAVFLYRFLQTYNVPESDPNFNRIKGIIKRLIEDKEQKVRMAALKLTKFYCMKNEVYQVIRTDPSNDLRKSAIEQLTADDNELISEYLTESLQDPCEKLKIKTISYYIKEQVIPNSEGFKCLFNIIDKSSGLVKNKAKELVMKILNKSDIVTLFKHMNLFTGMRTDQELYSVISSGFSEIYSSKAVDLMQVIKDLFQRLINEKEKIDLEILFVLRLSISLYKNKNISLQPLIDEFDLQNEFPKLLDFFLDNNEEFEPYYYMKLQSIIIITYIDLEEHASEILMNKYMDICKKVKLYKFQQTKNRAEISDRLIAEMNENLNLPKKIFAENEEEIISTIVEIVREKFRDAERHYFLTLQDLVESIMNGIQEEEQEENIFKAPLQVKFEKTEKKIRENEDIIHVIKQEKSTKSKKETKELKDTRNKLNVKKDLLKKKIYEKQYRSLLVISYILQYADLGESINPEYSNMAQTFFIRELDSDNLYISTLALKCLGFSCLLSKDLAKQFIGQFLKRLKNKTEIINLMATVFVFDIIQSNKIQDRARVSECIDYLWKSLKSDNKLISLNTLVEGFAKLLLRNMVESPVKIFIHLFDLFFDQKNDIETDNIIHALFTNYIKISEVKAVELVNFFLVHVYLRRRNASLKLVGKNDEKIYKFSLIFDHKNKMPYEKTENLQFLIFAFCAKFYNGNPKFFCEVMVRLNFEDFSQDAAKFVKCKLNELQGSNTNKSTKFVKMVSKLRLGTEIVEDIYFREYDHRIKDIISQAEELEREHSTIIILD